MLDKINGNISRLKSSENPLSADVYFVYGKEYTYIIDVGANEQALELVSDTQNKKIIITHFHHSLISISSYKHYFPSFNFCSIYYAHY